MSLALRTMVETDFYKSLPAHVQFKLERDLQLSRDMLAAIIAPSFEVAWKKSMIRKVLLAVATKGSFKGSVDGVVPEILDAKIKEYAVDFRHATFAQLQELMQGMKDVLKEDDDWRELEGRIDD